MSRAYIALGSNLGNPAENINRAVSLLIAEGLKVIKSSSFYKTEPYGLKDQPFFINSVVVTETGLNVKDLFCLVKKIETQMGREKTIKYGPRLIDLDIIFYDDLIYQDSVLTVPHPKMKERSFVLYPLWEIDSQFIHPLLKKTVSELKNDIKDNLGIEKIDEV
ncbi:MAG: 2-amino-4-hydroxy-6-hydroxymethyldihydropteridine diphosphokinase [Proteobacteria bacterium]|nr:2-amino-4-hydroxy-6-hydroxymethyldihydropteridine diphosphokinase [Pseudomonadota bacterium]